MVLARNFALTLVPMSSNLMGSMEIRWVDKTIEAGGMK